MALTRRSGLSRSSVRSRGRAMALLRSLSRKRLRVSTAAAAAAATTTTTADQRAGPICGICRARGRGDRFEVTRLLPCPSELVRQPRAAVSSPSGSRPLDQGHARTGARAAHRHESPRRDRIQRHAGERSSGCRQEARRC
eukprot:768455-Hanusia_phi.AAC.6